MNGQISIYEHLKVYPPVGSVIYFVTAEKIKKAIVISHDASFAGLPYIGYFRAQEKNGQMWSIKKFYNSLAEAKRQLT